VSSSQEYRRYAADCLRLSERAADPATKAALLDVARCWHTLADQADRNRRNDIVYETPPPPKQPILLQQQQIEPGKDDTPSSN
jgi:hypothetical protein